MRELSTKAQKHEEGRCSVSSVIMCVKAAAESVLKKLDAYQPDAYQLKLHTNWRHKSEETPSLADSVAKKMTCVSIEAVAEKK